MHELNNSCTCVVKGTSNLFHKWGKYTCSFFIWVSLVAQMVKNLSAMQDTWVQSLGWENPLKKGMQPTPVFLPGEFHGQRNLAARVHGVTKSPIGLRLTLSRGKKQQQKKLSEVSFVKTLILI